MAEHDFGKGWIAGTYGLKYPACVATADAVVYRKRPDGEVEIVVATRAPTRWEGGRLMCTIGGFIDPNDDEFVISTVKWEVMREELQGIKMVVEHRPLTVCGPQKWRYRWDCESRRAVKTDHLAQEIPVVTVVYLASYLEGELKDSDEVTAPHWVSLRELASQDQEFAFDHARVLEALVLMFLE